MNSMDSRNRSAFEIVADLRLVDGLKLAVLGSHNLDWKETRAMLVKHRSTIVELVGDQPVRLLTGCRDSGAEKAVRFAARDFTTQLAVVFHRAELTYTAKAAEGMMLALLSQEANALLVLSNGAPVCANARSRFVARNKPVFEIEIG